MVGEASASKMPISAEKKRQIYAEKKARGEKGLLTPKELVQREKGRTDAIAWS